MVDVAVLGGSVAGLWAAGAAASAGAEVLILDRDMAPAGASLRPGVPQGAQPHVLLHRGQLAGEELFPGLRDELLAVGAVTVDTGRLPWLGEHGWLPQRSSFEVLCVTRPRFEHVVREQARRLPGVTTRWAARVTGLRHCRQGWRVHLADGSEVLAPLVVDATGRSTRLRRWLADLGVETPEPLTVDAGLGYATQMVEGGPNPRDVPGVVIQATPRSPVGGMALPVEGGRWLVAAVGFDPRRPPREPDAFVAFLDSLPDPAPLAILRRGRPRGEVALHRQTGNRRQRYTGVPDWPEGLVAVGDALCCFDPVYGQGISVAACQALRLRAALDSAHGAVSTERLLRDMDRVVDFPWAVAIGQDLAMPSSFGRRTLRQAMTSAWASQVARRAVQGDRRAHAVLMRTYHLESSPQALLHPALVASVAWGTLRPARPSPRPAVLDGLTR